MIYYSEAIKYFICFMAFFPQSFSVLSTMYFTYVYEVE